MSAARGGDVPFKNPGWAGNTGEFDELVTHYPARQAALIPALHRCQEELGGWLRPEVLEALADYLGITPVEVFGVASFYPMFHLHPVGKHLVDVCHNIACELRGAEEILSAVCRATGARPGRVSSDGRFTVKRVECQGACTAAPMLVLDGTFHENLTPESAVKLLEGVR